MRLQRITLYPIKSIDGTDVVSARITPLGILEGDRSLALVDGQDRWIHGKSHPALHSVQALYNPQLTEVTLSSRQGLSRQTIPLYDLDQLAAWFCLFLKQPVRVLTDPGHGFPDDLDANGPTVVSHASLATVAEWFQWDVEQTHRRFRTNLVFDGAPSFFEDQLFGPKGFPRHFQIGPVTFEGINPCQRCAVPSRDPHTGEITATFQKEFMSRRNHSLPPWAELSQFNHFYRFALNTRIAPGQSGREIHLGDLIQIGAGTH